MLATKCDSGVVYDGPQELRWSTDDPESLQRVEEAISRNREAGGFVAGRDDPKQYPLDVVLPEDPIPAIVELVPMMVGG